MRERSTCNCVFCGAPTIDSTPKETLEICRWSKASQRMGKMEKTTVTLPICELCFRKLHPYFNERIISVVPLCFGVITAVCVLFSFIQRDIFSVDSIAGIISLFIFVVGGAFALSWFGAFMTFMFFDRVFKASIKVKPYSDLAVVKFIRENGFTDAEDDNCEVINTSDVGYVPFLTFRDILKKRFGLE